MTWESDKAHAVGMITDYARTIARIDERRKQLAEFPEVDSLNVNFSRYSEEYTVKNHEQAMALVKAIGGKFKRGVDYGGRLQYEKQGDITQRICLEGEHPTCKVVRMEEVTPAHMVPEQKNVRYKLVCERKHKPAADAVPAQS